MHTTIITKMMHIGTMTEGMIPKEEMKMITTTGTSLERRMGASRRSDIRMSVKEALIKMKATEGITKAGMKITIGTKETDVVTKIPTQTATAMSEKETIVEGTKELTGDSHNITGAMRIVTNMSEIRTVTEETDVAADQSLLKIKAKALKQKAGTKNPRAALPPEPMERKMGKEKENNRPETHVKLMAQLR